MCLTTINNCRTDEQIKNGKYLKNQQEAWVVVEKHGYGNYNGIRCNSPARFGVWEEAPIRKKDILKWVDEDYLYELGFHGFKNKEDAEQVYKWELMYRRNFSRILSGIKRRNFSRNFSGITIALVRVIFRDILAEGRQNLSIMGYARFYKEYWREVKVIVARGRCIVEEIKNLTSEEYLAISNLTTIKKAITAIDHHIRKKDK
jgi:hypothetical protein